MTKELNVYCDGSISPPNPGGTAISGWVVYNDENNEIVSGAKIVAHGTPESSNNTAEYMAVELALRDCLLIGGVANVTKITVHTDSLLVVNQLNCIWECRKEHLLAINKTIKSLVEELETVGPRVSFLWVPREMNTRADELSKSLHVIPLKCMTKKKKNAKL